MKLFLEDIQHSGRSGPIGKSREGEQYEERRNTYCALMPELTKHGTVVIISHYLTPDMTGDPILKTMTLQDDPLLLSSSSDILPGFHRRGIPDKDAFLNP